MKMKTWAVLLLAAMATAACDKSPSDEGSGLVGRIELSGAPQDGRLFTNHQFLLTATTYAPDNSLVTNAPLTWSTSDADIVTVQPFGDNQVVVRAVNDGDATITVSSDGRKATVQLHVVAVPIATVRIEPAIVGLYPGRTAQLRVVAIDSFGNDASSRAVTWTTSHAQRVEVSSTGMVAPEGLGEATITATIGGRTATAAVHALARPTSDWSLVTEDWVTHQGNAQHTGYVAATIDPLSARLKWQVPLFVGHVRPVTAAEGLVFVSGAIPAMHVLRALDAATGAQRWERHVGNNSSVDGPGYGNGNVYVQTGGHQDSFLHGFNAATGTPLFASPYGNQWSTYLAPVVVNGHVYMAGGYYGGMYSFDGTTGAQRWFRELNQYDQFTPLVHNNVVYAYTGSYQPKLTAASAGTGTVLYEIADPGFDWSGWSMGSSLTMASPTTLVAAQTHRLLMFDLATRSIRWVVNGAGYFGQPAYANGVIYVARSNEVEARRETDGGVIWSWRVPGDANVVAPPVVTRNLLFVSTGTQTYALDLATGAHTWTYDAGGHLTISRDGTMYIARSDGILTALTMR
jgi:outer membrane protein assembly factor BamB